MFLFIGKSWYYSQDSECHGHWCISRRHAVEHNRTREVEPPPGLLCPPDSLLPPWGSLSYRPCCVLASQQVCTVPRSRPDLQRIGSCHQDQQKWPQCECSAPLQAVSEARDKVPSITNLIISVVLPTVTYLCNLVFFFVFCMQCLNIYINQEFIEYKNCLNLPGRFCYYFGLKLILTIYMYGYTISSCPCNEMSLAKLCAGKYWYCKN